MEMDEYQAEITSITLRRGPCFGTCPMYEVTLAADGAATWYGERFVDRLGRHQGQVDVNDFGRLARFMQRAGTCQDWAAFHDHMPPGPSVLRVQGTCRFDTAGYSVELRRHEPQGINPRDLLLDRIVTPPDGPVAQVVKSGSACPRQPVRRRVGTRGRKTSTPERTGFQSDMRPWRFTVVGPQPEPRSLVVCRARCEAGFDLCGLRTRSHLEGVAL
jgi:Domain of unknown function (DUF6438)